MNHLNINDNHYFCIFLTCILYAERDATKKRLEAIENKIQRIGATQRDLQRNAYRFQEMTIEFQEEIRFRLTRLDSMMEKISKRYSFSLSFY